MKPFLFTYLDQIVVFLLKKHIQTNLGFDYLI